MKLLMLDDEEYVLESIRKNVDWERQGIREIYWFYRHRILSRIFHKSEGR